MTRAVWIVLPLLAVACGGANTGEKPLRSPSMDYPPASPQTTADGDTLGANHQDLGDAIETGPSIRSGPELGDQSYNAPGWTIEDGKPKYDAERRGNKNTSATVSEEEEKKQTNEVR